MTTQTPTQNELHYMPGFENDFETEALPGALPQGMNSPQKVNYGLYGEQLSGTAFTAPGHQNERTWCYRIRPSVQHQGRFSRIDLPYWKSAPHIVDDVTSLGQYRPRSRPPGRFEGRKCRFRQRCSIRSVGGSSDRKRRPCHRAQGPHRPLPCRFPRLLR